MKNFIEVNKNHLEWLADRNRSKITIQTYQQRLAVFFQTKNQINTNNIRDFLKENVNNYQPNTLKIFRYALSSLAKFSKIAIDWERINGIIPKFQRRPFSTLDEQEFKQLKFTHLERNKTTYQRNNLILDFLFYTGVRVSELVNIRGNDYHKEQLWIYGKGNKVRFVCIPPWLEKYFNHSPNYLFVNRNNKPLATLVIRQIIQQRLKSAGIKKPITPHSFRRSFATLLHNNGTKLTTIQNLLGHDSITTTEKYIQNNQQTIYDDYSKLWKNETILTK